MLWEPMKCIDFDCACDVCYEDIGWHRWAGFMTPNHHGGFECQHQRHDGLQLSGHRHSVG
eukprot:5568201-Ditylum_brightwellii.AAC.1